jgi:branched-chain amino acid transport system substrate-binding protein
VICDAGKCENKVVAPLKWASAELVHPTPTWSNR